MAEPPLRPPAGSATPDAQAWLRRLAQDPGSLEARLALARASLAQDDPLTATAWLSDACRVAPDRQEPATRLAELLLGHRQFGQARDVYRRLYESLGARDRSTLLHYGFCLEQLGDLDGAVARYREAATREPGFLEAHVNLAGVLWRVGEFDRALDHARAAVQLAPNHPYAVRILGTALLHLNRLEEAELQLRRALALKPDFVAAQLDLAFTLLLAGRLQEGWECYERRWNDTARLARPPFFNPALEWRGPHQPLEGRHLVVYAEQGLGDTLQCLRYVPMLQALGARVTVAIQPPLVPLALHSFPGVECLTGERGVTADLHAALLDLPGRFGTMLETVPAEVPYLRAPPERAQAWRARLAPWNDRLKIGIAWCGDLRQVNNRNRAIALSQWQALWQLPGVQCFSLQKGDAGRYTDLPVPADALVDLTGDWQDFADSAAMLEQLDLVIAVDTAVAHLAGALGRPAWVLLPPNPDWRWLLERGDSPWYPGLRLFRRDFGEPPAAQLARVRDALQRQLAPTGPSGG